MQINLLPGQLEKRKTAALWQGLKKMLFAFIFLWLFLGGALVFLASNISAFKKRISKLQADWRTTEPMLKERDHLIKERQGLGEFLLFINKHLKKGVLWSEKLAAFSGLVPEEIWLNEISLKREGQDASLEVWASVSYLKSDEEMLNKINSFIEEIKKDNAFFKDFQSLSLFEINKAGGAVEKVMNFRFSLSLKPQS